MSRPSTLRVFAALACGASVAVPLHAAPGVLLFRHAPSVAGTVTGSIQQMDAEPVTLTGTGSITGSLLVPGSPSVRQTGAATLGGSTVGLGTTAAAAYTVTVAGHAQLGQLVTATDPVPLPTVAAPAIPTATQTVVIDGNASSAVDFTGVRDVTLGGNSAPVALPPGDYGDVTVNAGSGLVLGIAGATTPAAYGFQHLRLNGRAVLAVAGPVVLTIADDVVANGTAGRADHPEWLSVRLSSGGLTLDGTAQLYGYVLAPAGRVTVNGGAQLTGGITADALVLDGSSSATAIDLPAVASITSPADGSVQTAPIAALTLAAAAADPDGYVTKAEFFAGATKLGEVTTAPFAFTWTAIPAATYTLTTRVTDNAGVSTTSALVTFIANAPPTCSLASPPNGGVFATPGAFAMSANAADSDGWVAKVEFFQGTAKIGEVAAAPYQCAVSGLPVGTYTFTARATDNWGAATDSTTAHVIVEIPPTAALTAPASVARGAGITLAGTATDADGWVAKVEFYRNGALIGALPSPTTTPSTYAFTDSAALPPGTYHYTVRSYDNLGLFTDSPASAVVVLATLPYTADFEPAEGYAVGPIDGQLGWSADATTAAIAADAAYHGAQSVTVPPDTPPVRVTQAFAPYPGHDVVLADFFARLVAEADPANATTFDVEGARFAFALSGATAVLNAFNGDGHGGGTWQPTRFTVPLGTGNQARDWVRLTARLDFAHKTWDLYAGGAMVAADLGLRDAAATGLASFAVSGDAATATRFDYLYAGADNPLFADTNGNGIDDAWETAHGLSLTASNRNDDPDGDGATNVAEYIAGTDPQDYYNGSPPILTSLVAANGAPGPGGLVAVRVTTAAGAVLANAPLTFQLAGTGATLAASPSGTAAPQVSVRSDATGVAQAYVTFATTTTADVTVTAASSGGTTSLTIHLVTGFDFHGEKPVLKVLSGSNQPRVSGFLPLPVVIGVYHSDGTTPWPGAPVSLAVQFGTGGWSATAGGAVSPTLNATADANGRVQAYYWVP